MKRMRPRILRFLVLIVILLIGALLKWVYSGSLYFSNTLSGWILVFAIAFLAAYNIRKKFPFIPLGRSSTWLQLHLYCGLLCIVVFIDHIQYRFPNGQLEVVLFSLFVLVAISGIAGAIISRVFARRLAGCREEIIYERIPIFQSNLRLEVEGLIFQSVSESNSTWLASLHATYLHNFFRKPRFLFHHIVGSNRPLSNLLTKLEENKRYLNETERKIITDIATLVKTKYNLDYHFALQSVLKLWLFVHIPLTYALILLTFVHVILAFSFSGSLP